MRRKTRVLEPAARIGNVRKTCRYFGVARSGFYVWKKASETHGDEGLVTQKPCPYTPRLRTPPDIVEKGLHLRRPYHLGPIRIVWYLERYHGITISKAGVSSPRARPTWGQAVVTPLCAGGFANFLSSSCSFGRARPRSSATSGRPWSTGGYDSLDPSSVGGLYVNGSMDRRLVHRDGREHLLACSCARQHQRVKLLLRDA